MPAEAPRRARSHQARSAAAASDRAEARLGEKISVLYRIEGDPDHPYSEAVGLLRRVDASPSGERTWLVVKRDGTEVHVPERAVVSYRVVPPGRGPVRPPASWGSGA